MSMLCGTLAAVSAWHALPTTAASCGAGGQGGAGSDRVSRSPGRLAQVERAHVPQEQQAGEGGEKTKAQRRVAPEAGSACVHACLPLLFTALPQPPSPKKANKWQPRLD